MNKFNLNKKHGHYFLTKGSSLRLWTNKRITTSDELYRTRNNFKPSGKTPTPTPSPSNYLVAVDGKKILTANNQNIILN